MKPWQNPLPLIPEPMQPHVACLATILGTSALGLLAEHMAGPWLAFAFATLLAKMAGEQIASRWA